MTEWATYDYLSDALGKAIAYGYKSIKCDDVRKAFRNGKRLVYHRVKTPAPDKIPVFYTFARTDKDEYIRTQLVLEGSEGDSYAGRVEDEDMFYVIHSHAINRFVERRQFHGSHEVAERHIINGLLINDVQKDGTDETRYIYFDGGLFLCTVTDRVLHLRTFIMNRQCSPVQRMKSLTSEKNTEQLKREYGIK